MIAGSLVALVTPFRNDELDEDAVRKMLRWHIEQGTHGIVPVGTTAPATGSTIIHAISSAYLANISFTSSILLKLTVRVCLAKSSGIPGEFGTPNVNAPEPAFTNNASA